MEISGKVILILEPENFTSKKNGNTYVRHTFIVETGGTYPKKIAFSVLGDDKFKSMGIVVGGSYNVSFDIDSREWKGRWYCDISAWKAVRIDVESAQAQQVAQPMDAVERLVSQTNSVAQQEKTDDLPF